MANTKFYGTGRRKSSIARVYLVPGTGKITVNKRDMDEYFGLDTLKIIARQPLEATNTADKYDVKVTVRGGGFTGQAGAIRHGIARALLKKPKILILDDSTSAVDTATEAKIRQAFTTSLKHSTKIIIAQRITSVIDADKIIVLEDGKIIGMGNHNELMKNCEEYRDIYYSQTDKEKEVS